MTLGTTIARSALLLGAFAIACTLLITLTWLGTNERIALVEKQARQQALLKLIPRSEHANDMLTDTLSAQAQEPLLQLKQERAIYRARDNQGRVTAVIIPARTPEGYSGDIQLLVAVRRDLSVAGVRVVSHRETPGLGDKIETQKSSWISQFNNKSLRQLPKEQWAVKKDGGTFDQLTGATISSRAVSDAVKNALRYASNEHQRLFSQEEISDVNQ